MTKNTMRPLMGRSTLISYSRMLFHKNSIHTGGTFESEVDDDESHICSNPPLGFDTIKAV